MLNDLVRDDLCSDVQPLFLCVSMCSVSWTDQWRWGTASPSRWSLLQRCTGPAQPPGRTQAGHPQTGRWSKGWETHLGNGYRKKSETSLQAYSFFWLNSLSICCVSSAYLHRFYNKGKGSARRFLIRRSLRPQTGQSPAYWPTSPSAEPCLRPRPRAACLGSSPVKVSGCPCESPSGIGASLFVPCCGRQKKGKDT